MTVDGYRATIVESLEILASSSLRATRSHWWRLSTDVLALLTSDPWLSLVEVKTSATRGVRTYTFEGPRLPAWHRGNEPLSLGTLARLKQYRALRRIYDIRWPGQAARSSAIVFDVLDHEGHVAGFTEDWSRPLLRRPGDVVIVTAEDLARIPRIATADLL